MAAPVDYEAIRRLHTHPDTGSRLWLDRLEALGLSWQDVVERPDDIPPMSADALRPYGIEGMLPTPMRTQRPYLVTGETSGFSGQPVITCFTEEEFVAGFVAPFVDRARAVGFPLLGNWLWAGPTGPHIVGKALHAILRSVGGTDAFAVDFDPRWFRMQAKGALSARRYFQHILDQIDDIMARQEIDVLYATPPVIEALAESLPQEKRERIGGVHYAGMAMVWERYTYFRESFPNAVHMSGYGNSLFGMFPETDFTQHGIAYGTASPRLQVRVVQEDGPGRYRDSNPGEEGRIMVSRYDQSVLILNMLLEDVALRTPDGICNPHRPQHKFEGKLLY
jgi:thienamycin biosynthesis protein ThnN